jgi:hypothetical protein
MADPVNFAWVNVAWVVLLAVATISASGAEVLDPTRPPPGYRASERATDPQSPDATGTPAAEPVSVQMIARDGSQRLAVINGHRVRSGDTITLDGKSARVVSVGDDVVVLDRGGHRQVLELMPRSGVSRVCAADSPVRTACRNDVLGAQP